VIVQKLPALSSVLFSVALRDNSSSEAHMFVQGLAAGTYDAVIFDIEKNGIPQIPNTLAAGTENVTVSSGPQFKTGGKALDSEATLIFIGVFTLLHFVLQLTKAVIFLLYLCSPEYFKYCDSKSCREWKCVCNLYIHCFLQCNGMCCSLSP